MSNTVTTINNFYGAAEPLIGEVKIWLGGTAPDGWKEANGQLLLKADYPTAYGLFGSTYDDGNAIPGDSFALPNFRDRTLLGAGGAHALGTASGSNSVVLTNAQIPGVPINTAIGAQTVAPGVNYIGQAAGGPASAGIWSVTPPTSPNQAFLNGPEVPSAVDITPKNLAVKFLVYVGAVGA